METIPVNVKKVSDSVKEVSENVKEVSAFIDALSKKNILKGTIILLRSISEGVKTKKELLEELGVTDQTYNKRRFIDPLIKFGLLKAFDNMSYSSPNLKFEITEKGLLLLDMIDKEVKN